VELGDAGVGAGALVGIERTLNGGLDAGGEDAAQVGGDLLDLVDLGRDVAEVGAFVVLAHAAASVTANEGWPEPGSG
jgi:hypothetical protein